MDVYLCEYLRMGIAHLPVARVRALSPLGEGLLVSLLLWFLLLRLLLPSLLLVLSPPCAAHALGVAGYATKIANRPVVLGPTVLLWLGSSVRSGPIVASFRVRC